jgi:hypothetical protein
MAALWNLACFAPQHTSERSHLQSTAELITRRSKAWCAISVTGAAGGGPGVTSGRHTTAVGLTLLHRAVLSLRPVGSGSYSKPSGASDGVGGFGDNPAPINAWARPPRSRSANLAALGRPAAASIIAWLQVRVFPAAVGIVFNFLIEPVLRAGYDARRRGNKTRDRPRATTLD